MSILNIEFSPHDTLFQLAIVLVAGIIGGEIFGLLRLPKVDRAGRPGSAGP